MTEGDEIFFSVVIPVYGSLNLLPELVERLSNTLSSIVALSEKTDQKQYEIILVDDCGPGEAWMIIQNLAKQFQYVKGIKLSRNFGQHYAISAGLDNVSGEWTIVMDCDLQDLPEEIPAMFAKTKDGFDIVLGQRINRTDNFIKKSFSKLFYATLSYLSGLEYDPSIANFGVYNREVINAVTGLKEKIRFFPSMVKWVGFKSISIGIKHGERKDGESGYSFNKLINLALDIMLAYSDKPLRLAVKLGLTISIISMLLILITIIRYALGLIYVEGYFSIILSVWFLGGLIIFILGMVGLYIGKTFEGVKNRPIYIIDETTNLDTQN